jgi:phage gpG-like protein
MTHEEAIKHLQSLLIEINDLFTRRIPKIAGTTAVRYFKQSFQNEAWGKEKWKNVKRRINPKNKKRAGSSRKILTGQTGDLGRSIEVKDIKDGTVTIWTDPNSFSSKEPYGRVHNEGLPAGRGKGFIMPKRQFMGGNEELKTQIINEIERKLNELKNKYK